MIGEKEGFKRFVEITKAKENEGYLEWKKWVLEKVDGCKPDRLLNMIKRIEIKKEVLSEKRDYQSLLKDIIPFLTVFLTSFVTLTITPLSNLFAAYNSNIEKDIVDEYAKLVTNTSLETSELVLTYCMLFVAILALALAFEKWYDIKNMRSNAMLKIYYGELLVILREKLEDMPKEEIDQNTENGV